jgi:hypothetical protein
VDARLGLAAARADRRDPRRLEVHDHSFGFACRRGNAPALGSEQLLGQDAEEHPSDPVLCFHTSGRTRSGAPSPLPVWTAHLARPDLPGLAHPALATCRDATGSDVAIESAGITLLGGDLRGIVRARRLSRGTMRNIRQNLVFAFAYNLLGVPIAAGVLYPIAGLLLSPMIASAAMSASSVSVIGNALRLRRLAL